MTNGDYKKTGTKFLTALNKKAELGEALRTEITKRLNAITNERDKTIYISYIQRNLFELKQNSPALELANKLPEVKTALQGLKLGGVDFPLEVKFKYDLTKKIGRLNIEYQGQIIGALSLKKTRTGDSSINYHFGKDKDALVNKTVIDEITTLNSNIISHSAPELIRQFFKQRFNDENIFMYNQDVFVYNNKQYGIKVRGAKISFYNRQYSQFNYTVDLATHELLKNINTSGAAALGALLEKEIDQKTNIPAQPATYLSRAQRYSRHYAGRRVVSRNMNTSVTLPPLLNRAAPTASPANNATNPPVVAPTDPISGQPDIIGPRENDRNRVPVGPLIPLGTPEKVEIKLTNPYVGKPEPEIVIPPELPEPKPRIKPQENPDELLLQMYDDGIRDKKSLGIKRILRFSKTENDFTFYYAHKQLVNYIRNYGPGETAEAALKEAKKYHCAITKNNDIVFYRALDGEEVVCHLFRDGEVRQKFKHELPKAVTFAKNVIDFISNVSGAITSESAANMRGKNTKMITEEWLLKDPPKNH